MSIKEVINQDISKRICSHMNKDHEAAVRKYATHYGGQTNYEKTKMTLITNKYMEIDVDGKIIQIKFDKTLSDSNDAHKVLVQMIKSLPSD
tara:strand:+ start:764 stop:1036 length:273 start_codon:yes stop_codon:yes gene_type:complete